MLTKIISKIPKIYSHSLLPKASPKVSKLFQSHVSLLNNTKPIFYFSSNKNNESAFQNPQVFHSDKEFQEGAEKVDIHSEQASFAFETDLQATSIKLLKATSSTEVLNIYEKELSQKPDWSGEELCLVLYFACYYKTNVIDDPRFSQLIESIFSKLENISALYLFTLIHSLGIYCFEFGLNLSPIDQQKLGNLVLKNLDNFELNQVSAISWSTAQIISSEENKELKEEVITKLGELLLRNSVSLTGLDYANILSTFSQCGVKNEETISKFVASVRKSLEKLENEDLNNVTRLVMALGELPIKDNSIFVDLFENIIRPQIHNFSIDDVSALILIYADKVPTKPNYFRELIKNVHVNYPDINITGYLNIWLAMAKYRVQATDLEKTIGILKRSLVSNKIWRLQDLESFELVNVLIAMSTIKVNDKELLQILSGELESRLADLDNTDLVNLARAYTLYVKQDEDFYLRIHNECVDREKHLGSQDKKILKDTFTKAKKFLPSSPFVDVTLY